MQKGEQSLIIPIAIILLGLLGGYLYYSQILTDTEIPMSIPSIPPQDKLTRFENFNFSFSIVENTTFKALKLFGEAPVLPGVTGRTDVFAPF